jgi:hypothetical protein
LVGFVGCVLFFFFFLKGGEMSWYQVALWRWSSSCWPEVIEEVQEYSPGLAVFAVMRAYGLRFVDKATVVEVVERPDLMVPESSLRCWRMVVPMRRMYRVVCPREEVKHETD